MIAATEYGCSHVSYIEQYCSKDIQKTQDFEHVSAACAIHELDISVGTAFSSGVSVGITVSSGLLVGAMIAAGSIVNIVDMVVDVGVAV